MHDHLMHSVGPISHITDVVFKLNNILHRLFTPIANGETYIDIPHKGENLQTTVQQTGAVGNLRRDRTIH